MFEPELMPEPDDDGIFLHPDLPGQDEEEEADTAAQLIVMGYECTIQTLEIALKSANEMLSARLLMNYPGEDWTLVGQFLDEGGAPTALYVRPLADDDPRRHCIKCGCTPHRACLGGCYWVAPNLCSACEEDASCTQN